MLRIFFLKISFYVFCFVMVQFPLPHPLQIVLITTQLSTQFYTFYSDVGPIVLNGTYVQVSMHKYCLIIPQHPLSTLD